MPLSSMTGYGRASGRLGDPPVAVTVEVRSVNSRNVDIRVRTDFPSLALEAKLDALIRSHVERGHVELRLSTSKDEAARLRPNLHTAAELRAALEEIRQSLGLADPVRLDHIVSHPELFKASSLDRTDDSWAEVAPIATLALQALNRARTTEGQRLGQALQDQLRLLSQLADRLASAAAHRPADLKRDLDAKLARLDPALTIDPLRLTQEVALLAQRLDTTEEHVRLRAHLAETTQLLASGGSIGRRLDFLLQEAQRELNTLAAKSQSAEISSLVAQARAEVEKMREQVQNLE